MVLPPEDVGTVNATDTTPPLPPDAVPIVGAPGTVVAVIDALAPDDPEEPVVLAALTEKVYEVALCSPVTVTGEEAPVPVNDPGLDVTV